MNPLILPTIPMAFAFLLPLTSKLIKNRGTHLYALAVTLVTFILSIKLFTEVYSSTMPITYAFGNWKAPVGIIYEVDRLGALLALVVTFLMFVIAVYSTRYVKEGVEWYYTLYLGLEAGLLGIVLTGDAFNLFVMLEVTAIVSYGLVMFYTEEGYPAYAGLRYAIISSIGTTLYFLALAVIYKGLGTVNLADIAAKLNGIYFPISQASQNFLPLLAFAMALTTWAFTIKSAIMPNHFWLPGAHSAAPSPVSAVLSGLVVNAGLYGFIRFLTFMGAPEVQKVTETIATILIILGATSALLASMAMVVQEDVKRIVAYSTILNMGYIAIAVGIGTSIGLKGAVFHMVNHAIAKALLFLAVGAFIHSAGTRRISELAGLGKKMPLTTITLGIATVSLVGLPPTNVFFSKLTLYDAYLEKSVILVVVLILSSLLALASYMRMFYWLWVKKPEGEINAKDDPVIALVLLLLAVICIVSGILSPIILEKIIDPAVSQLLNVKAYIKAALLAGVK